jgi:nitroreductase
MELFEAMRKRRMHRAFAPDPVPAEALEKLLWAASRAVTAKAGIRHLVVVDDDQVMRTLRQACPGFINNAPLAIAICSDLRVLEESVGRTGVEGVGRLDAGTAAAHLSVAAPALGLGICFVMSFGHAAVRAVLDLPEHFRPEILVAVGVPAEQPSQAAKAIPPIVHHNTYGTAWEGAS